MTKPLQTLCLLVILACASLAIISNLQSADVAPLKQQALDDLTTSSKQTTWLKTLKSHPQFTPEEQVTSKPLEEKVITISDAQLVGIVVDQPRYVLIDVPNSANSLTQLSMGETWLEGWEIKQILPDYVIWIQPKTNNEHTQFLFDASTQHAVESKKSKRGNK